MFFFCEVNIKLVLSKPFFFHFSHYHFIILTNCFKIKIDNMIVLRHPHIRRQEILLNNGDSEQDDYGEGSDRDYESSVTFSSSIGLPSATTTENPYDTTKAIGEEVMGKLPRKYAKQSLLKENIRTT
jgi:hypothetical protein